MTINRILVTAAMIVRNEEKFLDACLTSLAGLADEIVVVDTGSVDSTREIARQHGARVCDFAWTDDFSAARNHALSLAQGEWILYIDADERVREGTAALVRNQLASAGPTIAGEYAQLHPRVGATAYRVLRLFRNHSSIRFEGVIHETIWPSFDRYCREHDSAAGLSELVLDHFGYEGDQERKHHRNLPLLQRAIAADPLRIYARCHLADTYLALGESQLAEDTWRDAIAVVTEYPGELGDALLPFIGLIQFRFSQGRDATSLLREARIRYPDEPQLLWLESQILMRNQAYRAAIPLLESLVHMRLPSVHALAYDPKIFDLYPYRSLADCHFRLKDFHSAARYSQLARTCDPESREYRLKEDLCRRLALQTKPIESYETRLEQTH